MDGTVIGLEKKTLRKTKLQVAEIFFLPRGWHIKLEEDNVVPRQKESVNAKGEAHDLTPDVTTVFIAL